ncbi:hypothetical protein J5N97_014957 [Dioscorea zingiberensis]|uniref:Transketolase-like pyrimidine-binding domain-containing protein n=1 Tax=Dioscorea zingiberensis TaxID=325984 RepID=A0A9D5CUF9_9LILI|nr:hypothetical protein J5N97_014957 [Dioscorea zingiberensis]
MYHMGTSRDRPTRNGKRIHLSLVANPSHLEAVDPVVVRKTRAKQYYSDDTERLKNSGVLIHGDGSFAGQGVVFETYHLSALPNYTTGGTIHIVLNNQVAFTTEPSLGRSSQYCTDVAKTLSAPIFHVNGNMWRQWSRFEHNEINDPFFTQPKMCRTIGNHPSALEVYQRKLLESGQISKDNIERMHDKVDSILNEEFSNSKDYVPKKRDWLSADWAGFKSPEQISHIQNTGVKLEILKSVGKAITTLPENFKPHKMIETGEGIDWALGEALAFATLLVEGNHVRLSGQDVERGTFKTGEKFCPLSHAVIDQKELLFTVSNNSLSELAVVGFELCYSMENPNSLVIWEAQFGDFANGAQVMFDQFWSSGESKWLRQTGLVLLLPHGYDGQGPEHSSAQPEHFLQMSNDNLYEIPEMGPTLRRQIQECNLQVVNVTTPANYFHVLRRQNHREFRKPLVVLSPKNLLRHKDCKSCLSEFCDVLDDPEFGKSGTCFKRLIEDHNTHKELEEGIRRLILCSGKIYYELDEERIR